jgi:tRNA1Val (adenine37-N6)-methyltransferase
MPNEILPQLSSDEVIEPLGSTGLRIIQPRRGHRHAFDPILLCDFSQVLPSDLVADLGTGGGVIPLLLADAGVSQVLGIEIQPELADRARRSVLLNEMQGRIAIFAADLRQLPTQLDGAFDVVTANPPYRPAGHGRIGPDVERAAARFELAGGIADFATAAGHLLRPGGRCYVVFLAERLPHLLNALALAKLNPCRLRCVHHHPQGAARLVLVEGRKGGRAGLVIEPPLWVEEEGASKSEM